MFVALSTPINCQRGRYFRFWLIFSLLIFSSSASHAASLLGRDIPYSVIQDAVGELSFMQAVERLDPLPKTEQTTLSRGYVQDAYWLKFDLPAALFDPKNAPGGKRQQRWLELGPNFVDDIRIFYRPIGSNLPWLSRRTGDLLFSQSDIDYRNPTFILLPPESEAGYEVVIRVQSTSTTILQATLWPPEEFVAHATRTTSFWSFYFGLAAISTLLALVLAIVLGGRLLWSVTAFSITYLFVASIQGYINWFMPTIGLPLQHYMTSALTLTSYVVLLWLCAETVNMRQNVPWAYKVLMLSCVVTLLLMFLIPLDLYGLAVQLHAMLYLPTSVTFVFSVIYVWHRDRFRLSTLLLGLSPLICIVASMAGLFSAFGWIPFRTEIYVIWQYALVVNMLLVMSIAVYRIREKKLEELEKYQLASELKAERDASFHQRQFMGMVSHEFRTPLAVISGSLENLRYLDQGSSERTPRYEKIQRATERLVQLTDNCLADARLAADNLYLDAQPVNLFELVHSAAALVQLSDEHNLILCQEGSPANSANASPCTVMADTALIRIALSSVIDNAVKYSSGGDISIDCRRYESKTTVLICDEGSGITERDEGKIFERYRRGTHSKRGAGLGLYVARQVMCAHGGDLRLVSTSAKGSCFEFTFNLKKTTQIDS